MPTADSRAAVRAAQQKTFPLEDLGSVTVRRPGFGDLIKIGRRVTELSGGVQLVDFDAATLVRIRATLEATVEGDLPCDFDDPSLPYEAFFVFWGDYLNWLQTFRSDRAGKPAEPAGTPAAAAA